MFKKNTLYAKVLFTWLVDQLQYAYQSMWIAAHKTKCVINSANKTRGPNKSIISDEEIVALLDMAKFVLFASLMVPVTIRHVDQIHLCISLD